MAWNLVLQLILVKGVGIIYSFQHECCSEERWSKGCRNCCLQILDQLIITLAEVLNKIAKFQWARNMMNCNFSTLSETCKCMPKASKAEIQFTTLNMLHWLDSKYDFPSETIIKFHSLSFLWWFLAGNIGKGYWRINNEDALHSIGSVSGA